MWPCDCGYCADLRPGDNSNPGTLMLIPRRIAGTSNMAYASVPGPPAARAQAFIMIAEQPVDVLRIRYERRINGSIPGEHSTEEHRTYPAITVYNYTGPVVIQISLVTSDNRPHPHQLVGREGFKDGVFTIHRQITEENRTIQFKNLNIQCVTKKDVVTMLLKRKRLGVDPFKTGFTYQSLDLHRVRLAFQVFLPDAAGRCCVPLPAVASRVISDFSLFVERASHNEGIATGGTQVILLTKKLPSHVSVVFCEEGSGWQAEATIERRHNQFALVMKTPPYRDPNITHPVDVSYYLTTPSARHRSNLCQFMYIPVKSEIDIKRQKSPVPLLRLLPTLTRIAADSQQTVCSPAFPPAPSFGVLEKNWEPDPNVAGPSHREPAFVQSRRRSMEGYLQDPVHHSPSGQDDGRHGPGDQDGYESRLIQQGLELDEVVRALMAGELTCDLDLPPDDDLLGLIMEIDQDHEHDQDQRRQSP